MFPSFLTGKELYQFFESRMNLFNMCLLALAKPDAIKLHKNNLGELPISIKTAVFTILSKRGFTNDVIILKQLVNPDITDIDLSECVVTDEVLSYIINCKNLRKLDLSLRRRQTRSISTEMLTSLFSHLPFLKIIAIPHCKELTDEVLEVICQNCKQLIELHIPNSSITDYSLKIIGDQLHYLSVINLLGSQISDVGIELLTSGSLSKYLSEINIDKCPNVTLKSSRIIDENCPNIKIFTCGAFGANEESGLAMNGIRSKAKQVFWSV